MGESRGVTVPQIGEAAPEFHANTTQGELHFPQDFHGTWVVLFGYTADFTAVATSEIMTIASVMSEFKELGIEFIGLSVDSIHSHIAWLRKIKELSWKDIKHVEAGFPVIADVTTEIARQYGMLHPTHSKTEAISAVYIIDPEGKIRAMLFYPSTVGRNINEIKRLLLALQKSDQEKIVTPADWHPEEDVMLLAPTTCSIAAGCAEVVSEDKYCLDWFMCFRQSCDTGEVKPTEPEANLYPSMYQARNRYRTRR